MAGIPFGAHDCLANERRGRGKVPGERTEVTLVAQGQRSSQVIVPQARQALDQLKYEVAQEVGIPNYQGYLGDLPSRLNGAVGGNMVRRMIQFAEQQLAGGAATTAAFRQPTQQ